MREYFQQLRSQKFLRYIVLQDSRGALAAICQTLIEFILADGTDLNVEAFVENISSGAIVQELAKLDFCEDKTLAVTEGSDRAEALMKMQAARRDWLPVVDHDGNFAGVVDRSTLLGNLVLDVVHKLSEEP